MKRSYYALGRLKPGELNKTEQAFAKHRQSDADNATLVRMSGDDKATQRHIDKMVRKAAVSA